MTPDEWNKGMQNEAASVEDAGWAREARQAGVALGRRRVTGLLLGATAAYVLLGLAMTASFNAVSLGHVPALQPALPALPLLGFLLPLGATFWLTRCGLKAALACLLPVLGALLISLLAAGITLPIGMAGLPDTRVDLLPSMPASVPWTALAPSLMGNALAVWLGLMLALAGQRRRRA